ncbi:MAG: hypothetical protein KA505_07080 [Xanthomonadales bacterium]|nr:hypothetical protein [Xanthomonadales bacterium]MBP6078554.1 hypothetical protein [Xanthomonadales bacterium]
MLRPLLPLLRFFGIVAAINLLAFALFLWLSLSRVPDLPAVTRVHARQVASYADALAIARAPATTADTDLPWIGCRDDCDSLYLVASVVVPQRIDPDTEYAVYLQFFNDNAQVFVNGHRFGPDWGIAHSAVRRHWPLYAPFPGGLLHPGDNHVAVVVRGSSSARSLILMPFWVGRGEDLRSAYSRARWIGPLGHQVSALLTLATALIALALVIARRDPVYFWFGVCAVGAIAMLLQGIVPDLRGPFWLRTLMYFAGAFACVCFTPRFADAVLGVASGYFSRVLLWLYPVLLLFTMSLQLLPDVTVLQQHVWPGNLLRLFGAIVAPYLIWRCGQYAVAHADDRFAPWTIGFLSVAALCGGYDALKSTLWFGMWEISLVAFGAFFLTVAFLLDIARRVSANQRRMYDYVGELERAVAAREAELRRGFERIGAMQRVETLAEERRRIMQDMHDGVGGQLASLLVLSRDRVLEPARLLAALRDGLADLRLIVDSLSQVDDDLAFALGSLRGRIAPQLREAGIDLVWAIDPATSLPGFGPQAVLQVFRIVQEAVNNALRHGRARQIRIAFERTADAIELRIEDDGVGLPETLAVGGHGIGGMKARAAKCGADFAIQRGDKGGTRVLLRWPGRPNLA